MLLFALLIGVEQAHVAFAAAPEHVVGAAELDGGVDGVFDLHGSAGHHVEVGIGGSTVHVTLVAEHVGRAPKQLHAGFLHLHLGIVGDGLHAGLIFCDGVALGHEVDVVEAEIFDAELVHDFKACIHLVFGALHGIFCLVPLVAAGGAAKLVAGGIAQCVPPGHGKLQPVFHLLSADLLLGVIVVESHWIFTCCSFERNLADLWKILFCHSFVIISL